MKLLRGGGDLNNSPSPSQHKQTGIFVQFMPRAGGTRSGAKNERLAGPQLRPASPPQQQCREDDAIQERFTDVRTHQPKNMQPGQYRRRVYQAV